MEIDVKQVQKGTADNFDHRVSIIMINSRENSHPTFTERARNSVFMQEACQLSIDLIEIRNYERQYTIGKCWNEGVKIAAQGCVMFLGDDDYLSPEFVATMMSFSNAAFRQFGGTDKMIGLSSFMRLVDQNQKVIKGAYLQASHTGMYKREFLVENPFDESLKNNVDTEFMKRITDLGYIVAVCEHYFGYYYTIHPDMVSGMDRFLPEKRAKGSKLKRVK